MKKLELLGLQNDGEHLTLNDAEGNRYSVEITDELRALLRKDYASQTPEGDPAHAVSPREIQAYVRAGKTIEEISELTALSPSRIENLAHPIINERNYTARLARSLPTSRDPGSLTLEELVATRLASRGVKVDDIEWDAIRESGEPWTVIARYESAERERQAVWHVDISKRSLEAVSEEAVWLSETPILPHGDAWRAPNTPALVREKNKPASTTSFSSLPPVSSTPSAESPETVPNTEKASVSRIDAVLADLDARRGIPTDKEHYSSLWEANAASALESANSPEIEDSVEADESSGKQDNRETIFDLPVHSTNTDSSEKSTPSAPSPYQGEDLFSSAASADSSVSFFSSTSGSSQETPPAPKKVRRSDRPSMPTWDEIVFGKKD